MRRLRILFGFLCVLLVSTAVAVAQNEPEYTAFSIARLLSDDGTQVEAEFLVSNIGGDATQPATVELRVLGESTLLASGEVPPLATGGTSQLLLTFPISSFADVEPEVENIVFELLITSPEFDPVRRLAEFTIPAVPAEATVQQPPPSIPDEPSGESVLIQLRGQVERWLAFLPFEVDLQDPVQLASLLGSLLFLIVVLWLLIVIARLLLIPQPTYPPNPPPYAGMPPLNPDSLGGRRQMWQQVTQHGSMLAQESEGQLHARKLLMDTTGTRFSGWKVVGVRASQYDTYGRVTRSQVIAPRWVLRRLNGALSRAGVLSKEAAQRRVRPAARYLTRQLNRSINKRGAGLPIALDVKFRGAHGEVNIIFELYQFQLGAWRKLDSWQPEMTVPGKYIYEGYTYTVHGLHDGETMRQFRQRVSEDFEFLLTEMVLCTPPLPDPASFTRQTHAVPTEQNQAPVITPPTEHSIRPVPPVETNATDGETSQAAAEDDELVDTVANYTNGNSQGE